MDKAQTVADQMRKNYESTFCDTATDMDVNSAMEFVDSFLSEVKDVLQGTEYAKAAYKLSEILGDTPEATQQLFIEAKKLNV